MANTYIIIIIQFYFIMYNVSHQTIISADLQDS